MRIDVEVLVRTRGGRSRKVIHRIERDLEGGAEEGIGLGLGDMKAIVAGLQRVVVDEQAHELIELRSRCASCRRVLGHKGASGIVYRTPFGKFELASPRLYSKCPCGHRASESISFSPLGTAMQFPDPPLEPPEHALEIDAGYIRGIPEKCAGRRTFDIIAARLKKSRARAA